jgi:hypothetical protein
VLFLILVNAALGMIEMMTILIPLPFIISYVDEVTTKLKVMDTKDSCHQMKLYSDHLTSAANWLDLKITSRKCEVVHFIYPNNLTNKHRIASY